MEKVPFYARNWFLVLMAFVFPPLAIILLWATHRRKGKPLKIALTIVLVLLTVLYLAVYLSDGNSENSTIDEATQPSEAEAAAEIAQESQEVALSEYNAAHGEILSVIVNGTTVVVKAKISPSFSNKATIDQNYYNVCDLIRNQGLHKFSELQYWAVADMADGKESKVISFTVDAETIDAIYTQGNRFADNTLGEYVSDLWILPSLTK